MRTQLKRFQFAVVELTTSGQVANYGKVVRRNTSLDKAIEYATGRNHETASVRGDKEFAVVIRTAQRPSKSQGGKFPKVTVGA